MDSVFARIERWMLPVLSALLAFFTAGVFLQVVLRYAFDTTFLWAEELSLFAFVWSVYLGAAVCTWRRSHFSFDMSQGWLKGRAAALQRLLIDLLVLAAALLMLVEGWRFSQLSLQRLSPALGISLFVPTIVIPLSGALMVIATVPQIVRDCRRVLTGRNG